MISSEQEFESVLRQVRELKSQREILLRESSASAFQTHVEVAGLDKMISRLQAEIEAFATAPSRSPCADEEVVVG